MNMTIYRHKDDKNANIFRHDRHKLLWDVLANHPNLDKALAWDCIKESDRKPASFCYACDATLGCPCKGNCPIDWGIEEVDYATCAHDGTAYSFYNIARRCYDNINPFLDDDYEDPFSDDGYKDRHGPWALEIVSQARRVRDLPLTSNWIKCP